MVDLDNDGIDDALEQQIRVLAMAAAQSADHALRGVSGARDRARERDEQTRRELQEQQRAQHAARVAAFDVTRQDGWWREATPAQIGATYGAARGIVLEETAAVAGGLADDGVDYLHLSLGDARAPAPSDPTVSRIHVVPAAVPRELPIIATGGLWTPAEANEVLGMGADIVAIGEAAIANPDWATGAQDPAWSPARPPFSPEQLEAAGVTNPFLAYLRDGWPGLVER